ncbi:acyl-CoA N-acyltransferase [Nemania sp. NC0429]|nr:acyl-CoA N-acyltransferase [Nemania sp. NC0429]
MATQQSRPLGDVVQNTGAALPPSQDTKLSGRYVTLIGLAAEHIEPFYANLAGDDKAYLWDYLQDGPFGNLSDFRAWIQGAIASQDVIVYGIVPADQPTTPGGAANVVGCASYMNVDTGNRVVETGVLYSPKLHGTTAGTEALFLMARHAFETLGYRRCEWKCDALNAASFKAALRFGFTFEGTFRKHLIVKGRNRDTAWFSIVDDDWPHAQLALQHWLDPSNFDESGRQRKKLEEFRGT